MSHLVLPPEPPWWCFCVSNLTKVGKETSSLSVFLMLKETRGVADPSKSQFEFPMGHDAAMG